jgi:4-alpha-glucanotransferase
VCLSRRIVTNTPLQALVTLNDPVYVEAARHLGKKHWESSGHNSENAINSMYQALTYQQLSSTKKNVMHELFAQAKKEFERNKDQLEEFYPEGEPSLAAMAVVANAMLNLDEFLTKP